MCTGGYINCVSFWPVKNERVSPNANCTAQHRRWDWEGWFDVSYPMMNHTLLHDLAGRFSEFSQGSASAIQHIVDAQCPQEVWTPWVPWTNDCQEKYSTLLSYGLRTKTISVNVHVHVPSGKTHPEMLIKYHYPGGDRDLISYLYFS